MVAPKNCRKCRRLFKRVSKRDELCPKCLHKQPKCGSCHTVMAPGSLEGFGRKVGKYNICGGCSYELSKKGYLHISEHQWLLPSGRVRTSPLESVRIWLAASGDDQDA